METPSKNRKPFSPDQQRATYLAQQTGYATIERERHEALRKLTPADTPRLVAMLFSGFPLPPPRQSSGLVEQQYWFSRAANGIRNGHG
jgi:hypothetical protein